MEAESRIIFSIGGSQAVTLPKEVNAKAGASVYMIPEKMLLVDLNGELTKEELEDLYYKDLQPAILEKLMRKWKRN